MNETKLGRLKRVFLLSYLVLLALSLVYMGFNGQNGQIPIGGTGGEHVTDYSLTMRDGEDGLVEVTGLTEIRSGSLLQLRTLRSGSGWYDLMFSGETWGGSMTFYVHTGKLGLMWLDNCPQASEPLTVVNIVGLLLLIVYLGFKVSVIKKKTPYSYRLAANIGLFIYCVYMFVTLMILLCRSIAAGSLLTVSGIMTALAESPYKFSLATLPVLGIAYVLMTLSNLILMRHEGIRPGNMLGAALGTALILGAVAGLVFRAKFTDVMMAAAFETGNPVLGVLMLAAEFFICGCLSYLECMIVAIVLYGVKAARHEPKYDKDYVIILGCKIAPSGKLYPMLRGRVERALKFMKKQEQVTGKQCVLVPSGGQGSDEVISEGEAMRRYLLEKGVPEERILAETASGNTIENMAFSGRLIFARDPKAKIAFSTTNYHVLRSGILAENAGLHAEGMGSHTKWYYWPNAFVRELAALFTYNKRMHVFFLAITLLASVAIGGTVWLMML